MSCRSRRGPLIDSEMQKKEMLTRGEFEELRIESARQMATDYELRRDALDVLERADRHRWVHQTTWFGEPVLQLPQDMFALQEIIFRTRPKFIVEAGVAWGGSVLFYSTLMSVLGGGKIIGIDVYIPDDLRNRIGSFGELSDRIDLFQGSSVEPDTLEHVRDVVDGSEEVMVVLDSNHGHDHVLKELQLYAPLVGVGQYLVCSDTVVEDLPLQVHRPRPWGPGNSPRTALDEFLKDGADFEVDERIENKLLLTCQPGGYLRRVR